MSADIFLTSRCLHEATFHAQSDKDEMQVHRSKRQKQSSKMQEIAIKKTALSLFKPFCKEGLRTVIE